MKEIHSADEMRAYAADFIVQLEPQVRATVIALSGELGAGKTTFAQGIAQALCVSETVSSPTFVIEKAYDLANQKWRRFIHIDAYRLKGAEELQVLRWDEITADPQNLIVLEWPERVSGALPRSARRLRFEIHGEGRIIVDDDGGKDGEKSEKDGKAAGH